MPWRTTWPPMSNAQGSAKLRLELQRVLTQTRVETALHRFEQQHEH